MKAGRLYLIPVPLGPSPLLGSLPEPVLARARGLKHFVAENAKTGRAFLKALPCRFAAATDHDSRTQRTHAGQRPAGTAGTGTVRNDLG
jgi:16S rRNA C1402 (ribose-2'-O) methylase RsmI